MSRKNIPPANRASIRQGRPQQQQVVMRQDSYQGIIPPPVILEQFDQLIPGTAAKIIQWAEDEQRHRHAMERQAQEANISAQQKQLEIAEHQAKSIFRSDIVGQALGFVVCLSCVAGAIALALKGQTAAAIALAAIPTAAIIHAFRSGIFAGKRPAPSQPAKK